MLTPPTVDDLANFTGQEASTFLAFSTEALKQATLLFELCTGLSDWPTDQLMLEIATRGVCDLASYIYEQNPYRGVKAKPFTSETVGMYSYTLKQAQTGGMTGLTFWDAAVSSLQTGDYSPYATGGISVFENDHVVNTAHGLKVMGPSDYRPYSHFPETLAYDQNYNLLGEA